MDIRQYVYYPAMVNGHLKDVNTLRYEFLRFMRVRQYVYYVAMVNVNFKDVNK